MCAFTTLVYLLPPSPSSEASAVDQQRIDKFAEATGDFQWIHVDVERAKASPYGGTIAHGFLTLSLLGGFYEPYLQHALPFCDLGLNYGLNKNSLHLARAQREPTTRSFRAGEGG